MTLLGGATSRRPRRGLRQLASFIDQVSAQSGKKFAAADADELIDEATLGSCPVSL